MNSLNTDVNYTGVYQINMSKKPTLKDIAAICECSVTTASRALKDSPTISIALRQKVHDTARELGYIPNALAESMRTGSTKTIAAIIQDFRNPFFSIIAKHIEKYTQQKGYTTLFFTTNESPEQEVSACINALGKNVDGILLFPTQANSESTQLLLSQNIPFCSVSRHFEELPTNYVISDDISGGYLITRHLIDKGAKNILFVNGPAYICTSVKREEGYIKALKEFGLSPSVRYTTMEYGDTKKIIDEIFSNPAPYDAVLTFCDIMGFEAYSALRKLGYHIPENMLLASFDGLQEDIIFPISLTSVGMHKKELAERSVDVLLDLMENSYSKDSEPRYKLMMEQFLIEGETT